MPAILLLAALTLSADWPDAKQVAWVQRYADGVRDRLLPGAKVVKVNLQVPGNPVCFIIWEQPEPPRLNTSQKLPSKIEQKKIRLDYQKSLQPPTFKPKSQDVQGEFLKWSAGFANSRRVMVTVFEFDEEAKDFEERWLSGLRNKQGGYVRRRDAEVVWGDWVLLEKL